MGIHPMIDINTLRQVPLFAELSDEQLQWLAEQGTEVWLESRVKFIEHKEILLTMFCDAPR